MAKFRYTAVVELDCPDENYPEGEDMLAIEKENADDILHMEIDSGEAKITVEQLD